MFDAPPEFEIESKFEDEIWKGVKLRLKDVVEGGDLESFSMS